MSSALRTAAVIPNWNGRWWLDRCLESLEAQTVAFEEVIVVDNGSSDGSVEHLAARWPDVRVLALGENTGFAVAANRGIAAAAAGTDAVALVNTDVELASDWLQRTSAALTERGDVAAVACKMVDMEDTSRLYDAGDVLRRDGVCEQRGRFRADDGRFDAAGDVFAACAGAALYRRQAIEGVGGFDERFFAYLEDVDLGLRLRLAGWRCRFEPVVARHAGGGSSAQLARPVDGWVARNTLLLVAKAFPLRWLPLVVYRQLAWASHAVRNRRLGAYLSGFAAALPLLPEMLAERRRLRDAAAVPVEAVVPQRPIRGTRAGGHPRTLE
jgi:GT2 family glycosyltransferase